MRSPFWLKKALGPLAGPSSFTQAVAHGKEIAFPLHDARALQPFTQRCVCLPQQLQMHEFEIVVIKDDFKAPLATGDLHLASPQLGPTSTSQRLGTSKRTASAMIFAASWASSRDLTLKATSS